MNFVSKMVFAILIISSANILAENVILRLAHTAPPNSAFDIGAKRMASHVASLSNGEIILDIIAGGVLGNGGQLLAQLKHEKLDLVVNGIAAAPLFLRQKEFTVMRAPYVFRDQEHYHAFLKSDLANEMMTNFEKNTGIKYLGYLGDRSPRALTTTDREVRRVEDLKGLKIRVPSIPIYTSIWKAWGANPMGLKASEIYTSLQSRLVDGQDNGILLVTQAGWDEVQKYYAPLNYVYSGYGVFVNSKSWSAFSENQKVWLLEAAYLAAQEDQIFFKEEMDYARAKARESGMILLDVDRASFEAAAANVVEEFDGKQWPAGLYAKIRAIK